MRLLDCQGESPEKMHMNVSSCEAYLKELSEKGILSGVLGGPIEYVANGNGNFSQLNLQSNHQFPGVFNLT